MTSEMLLLCTSEGLHRAKRNVNERPPSYPSEIAPQAAHVAEFERCTLVYYFIYQFSLGPGNEKLLGGSDSSSSNCESALATAEAISFRT